MPAGPVLTTERLTLHPITPDDADALHRHWTHPDVRRHLWDDVVIPRHRVAEVVQTSADLFATRRGGLWALRLRVDGSLIGCGGYWFFHEPPRLELVLSLDPAWWGHGLATEAGRALIAYGFTTLALPDVHASTDAPNTASIRLMERLGMWFQRHETQGDRETLFYRIARSAWEPEPPR